MRIGIDIDGVLADMDGAVSDPAGEIPRDFWEQLDELEPGMVQQLADIAAAEAWEVFFLTRRPETGGTSAQLQTERWLERHGFANPRVHIVRGSRGKLVHALEIDLLIDDTLANCLDVALESKAASILIWTGDPSHAHRSLRGMNVDIAASFGDAVERLTGRALVRHRRPVAPSAPSAPNAPNAPNARSAVPTRRTYALAAFVFGMFAIYGSLVPLEFRAVSFQEALDRFSRVPYLQLGIGSRADFVSNILLFIPLGFLLSGSALTDRRGATRRAIAGGAIVVTGCLLSVAIEFTQLFFPPRTVSVNDMVAETVGAGIGVFLWMLFGMRFTGWLRGFFAERERSGIGTRVLHAYAIAFFLAQLLPLDLTLDLGELADKYREGRVILVPFSHSFSSPLQLIWETVTDVLLWSPVGALARVAWPPAGAARAAGTAMAIGALAVAAIEAGQVFVFTRYADATDLITGSIGIVLGVAAARSMSRRTATPYDDRAWRGRAALALVAWTAVLVSVYWSPFNFVLSWNALLHQAEALRVVPFHNYYYGSEFHAFTEISRKFMLAAPLGALLRMASARPDAAPRVFDEAAVLAAGFTLFVILEAGQLLLPGRIGDVTDLLIALAGVDAGRRLVKLLRRVHPGAIDTAQVSA